VTPLYLEELVLIGSAAWAKRLPARALETRGVALLDGIPLLAYAEEVPLVRRYWRKVFGRALAGQASIVVPDLRAIAQAVSAGAGITVLPRYLVEGMLERSEVIQLLEPKQPPVNQLWLVARPGPRSQPRVEFVKAQIARASSAWGTSRGEV
jgi:DNA-binding transcriptional LysR family regulator